MRINRSRSIKIKLEFLLSLTVVIAGSTFAQTSVLTDADKPAEMMETYLRAKTVEAFDRRAENYEKIKTAEDCAAHQQKMRDFFVQQIGGWPEKTPLNAKVVGTIDRGAYRIEKVIYESRPQFYVTALMYLPKTKPPYPAVLFPCGHDPNGKDAEAYQQACAFLAVNGIASLNYDPIGQGERAQMLDDSGKQVHESTLEHTMLAVSSIPLGMGASSFRIWDGIRSIDYLCSREDINKDKLGCTGHSGGGTMTSYLSALDDRIYCAAPNCYITSLKNLILKDGPHDGEQCIAGQLAFGMDQGDYLMIRAPKPTQVQCATRDFFPIEGTWDTYRAVKRFYTRLGYPERLEIAEVDEGHGYTPILRQSMVRWMLRWLRGIDEPVTEPPVTILSDAELQVSPDGQVLKIAGARSAWDIDAEIANQLAEQRKQAALSKDALLAKVREVTGIRALADLPKPDVQQIAIATADNYRVEKLVLKPEPGIVLPAVAYIPNADAKDAVLYVNGQGKAACAAACEALAKQGSLVLAVDLRNCGETTSHWSHGDKWEEYFGPSYKAIMLAYELNRPFVTMWAEDILVCARYLKERPENKTQQVSVIAVGSVGPAALHAAALDTESAITKLSLENTLQSWESIVRTTAAKNQLIMTVHAALRSYDLPDLVAALGERVYLVNAVDGNGGKIQ